MNVDDGRLYELATKDELKQKRITEADLEERLAALNRAERRADQRVNGTGPWVRVSPQVATIVKAGHAAMKAKKRRRKEATAARRRNRG